MKNYVAACLFVLVLASGALSDVVGPVLMGDRISLADAASAEPNTLDYSPPAQIRALYYNHGNTGDREGDCVFVSCGMVGVKDNNLRFATLPWATPWGPANRGAAGPSEVARACAERDIAIYNVTGGSINDTYPWAVYAAESGRGAAIGFGKRHFQTLQGFDADTGEWLICDNNSPERVDRYSDSAFRQLHAASGFWIVVLDGPAPPPAIENVIEPRRQPSVWQRFLRWYYASIIRPLNDSVKEAIEAVQT